MAVKHSGGFHDDDNLSLTKVVTAKHSGGFEVFTMMMILTMMMPKVLAERIEQNLEGMSKQLAKEVSTLEEVQKLQQVTILMIMILKMVIMVNMILKMVLMVTKRRIMMSKQLVKEVVLTPIHPQFMS